MILFLPCPPSLRSNETVDEHFRRDVAAQCRGAKLQRKRRYALKITFYGHWDNKDGSPYKRDTHNFWSKLADVLADCLGIDDSQFRPQVLDCVHKEGKEHVVVEIS